MIRKFTSEKQKVGELGEDIACTFLMKNGFAILERNYTRKWGEIDIIATKDDRYYFIEVKSVSTDLDKLDKKNSDENNFNTNNLNYKYRPEENMHPKKIGRLHRVVETYLIHKRIGNTPWQIDLMIVYIDINKRLARVKTLENLIL